MLICVNRTFEPVRIEFEENLEVLRNAEVVEQAHIISKVVVLTTFRHIADYAETNIRNAVPNALFIVAAENVGEVEQHVLVNIPIFIRVVVIAGINLLCPSTLELRTKTNTRRKPFTNGNIETERGAVNAERVLVAALFLRGVSGIGFNTCTYEPVCPERVGCDTILLSRSNGVLCHSS